MKEVSFFYFQDGIKKLLNVRFFECKLKKLLFERALIDYTVYIIISAF